MGAVDLNTIPRTSDIANFFHDGQNVGFLGDYVEVMRHDSSGGGVHLRGRIFDAHFHCPESDEWLGGQQLLGPDPEAWRRCRWVSVLVDKGGSVVVPDQFIRVVEPFDFENKSAGMYWPVELRVT